MASLTLKQARALFGKEADSISDDELEKYIEVASMLKDLFFEFYLSSKDQIDQSS